MKVTHKLLLAAALPATLAWAVGFYAASVAENSLRQAIEQTSLARASGVMDEIDRVIHDRITEWVVYVRSPVVKQVLQTSNRQFEQMEGREQYIDEQDREWRATPAGTLSPFMKPLTHNELAEDLRLRLAKLEQANGYPVFAEVFITNRYGANVGQTNRTTDYRQNDEDWWRSAMRDGLYVGDVGFDQSANVFSTDICVRIDEGPGTPLGILKAVFNIQQVINIVDARLIGLTSGGHHSLILFTGDNQIIHGAGMAEPPLASGSRYFHGVELSPQERAAAVQRHDPTSGNQLLSAYVTSKGHGSYKGLGWVLMLEYEANDVFQRVDDLRNNIRLIAAGATLLALGLAGAIALSMSWRIKHLTGATAAFGKGDFDATVRVTGTDELAQLGAGFNRMARDRREAEDQRSQILHDMGERVRELRCLHGVAESIRQRSALEDLFQDAAALLPPGWQYPEIARGRVHFDGKDYVSEPFERTRWSQTADIIVGGERRGFVEVCYLEQRPELDERPFLREERSLIDSVARALSEVAERKQAEAAEAARTVELEQQTIELEKSRRVAMGIMEDAEQARKLAEAAREELRDNEERLQVILGTIQAGVVVIEEEGHTIVDANPAALAMIGASREEVVGRVCHNYICPAEVGRCPITDLGQKVDNSERVLVKANGETIPVLKTVTPAMLNGRRHLLDSFVDLSKRKQAEEALAQAHRVVAQEAYKLRSMIEGMDEGIVVADADDVITEVNTWFLDKVGLGRDDVVGKSLWEFHPDTDGTARLRVALEAFRSGQRRDNFVVNRELLGMQLSLRVQPIFEGSRYRGVILNVINVTDLVEARLRAEAASRAKSEFLANMSHEIRTPMTAILGFADVLLEHGDRDAAPVERIQAAETIKRNGEYLIEIINDILDLSKIEAGKMTVEQIRCSPCRLVAEVTSLARVRADAKGLPFRFEYVGAVPETIRTDPTRLRQILINLIGNAIKFTEAGEVRLVTRFVEGPRGQGAKGPSDVGEPPSAPLEPSDPRTLGPCLQFDVLDTGIGMTEEQVARLFQPFTQADTSTTRKFGGTGLGLTISKRLARLLGGDIAVVETREGAGTRMRVTVATGPLDGVKMVEDPLAATVLVPDTTTATTGTDQPALQGCRILLAEDGPDNQRLIAHLLKKAGAGVTVAENGKLAVDAAQAARDEGQPFDVILMDMQMPVMDGYAATGLLRQKGYTGPVIALTAHSMTTDREKCTNAGCDDYVSKPINWRALIKTIHERLRKDTATPARPGESAEPLISELAADPDMVELVSSFVHGLPARVTAIEKALVEENFATLTSLAHQLKGVAGGYGLSCIANVAKELEDGAQRRDSLSQLRQQVQELAALCRRAQGCVTVATPADRSYV